MAQQLRLIVGLGNPGPKYARNRHNIGFMVLDELARRRAVGFAPVPQVGLLAVGPDLHLVKPLTYMNLSGEAVAAWSDVQGVPVTGVPIPPPPAVEGTETGEDPLPPGPPNDAIRPLVVCDDLALPLGSVRLRAKGSSGGQNGLESMIEHLGGEEFPRLRLGIAPLDGSVDPSDWPDYVLADFGADEAEAVADLVDHAASALESWLDAGFEPTVSRYNRRIRPGDAPGA